MCLDIRSGKLKHMPLCYRDLNRTTDFYLNIFLIERSCVRPESESEEYVDPLTQMKIYRGLLFLFCPYLQEVGKGGKLVGKTKKYWTSRSQLAMKSINGDFFNAVG